MSRLTRSRDVTSPPSEVWKLLAEFGAIVRWAPNVDHSCLLTEQADGVGAVRRVQSGAATVVERVVTWEPGLMLAYTIEGLPPIVGTATNTWLLRPVDGGTSVTLITDVDIVSTPLGLVAQQVLGRALRRAANAMLDGLEHAVGAAETTS